MVLFCRALVCVFLLLELSAGSRSDEPVFPHKMPGQKPDFRVSSAVQRMFEYSAPRAQDNELFSQFKYTQLQGFDYHGGDGTITRRDPSRPILFDGRYHVWYTKRDTATPPVGARRAEEATDKIPSTDWDLCEIWHATSTDGFTWEEQGVAVPRPPKPIPGWRSVATPDVLVWQGKYYLYYQAFAEPSGTQGDWCAASASYADSPDGPWTHTQRTIIPTGERGHWDQDAVHDPQPLVFRDKIYLYYKAAYNKWPDVRDKYAVGQGLAIAEDPLGPFVKHRLNPVMSSGHETSLFRFQQGIAAMAIKDGNERSTMQFAEDGVNFKLASVLSLPPNAPAPFSTDAFTNTNDGRGITWGLCHFTNAGSPGKQHSIMARYDCDLSLDVHDPAMKTTRVYHRPEIYFRQGLSATQRRRIAETNRQLIGAE